MPVLQKCLLAIHRHPRWSWLGVLIYAALVTFPHENVQYVVNEIALRITHKRLYQASAAIAIVEVLVLTWIAVAGLRRQRDRSMIGWFWAATILLIFGTWRLLTANNVELVHYPQYVPEGAALLALTLSPVESLAWVTIFGGLDECFQYWDLMSGRPVQYDFNDIYMDLLGGAAGVLLAMCWMKCSREGASWREILARPGVRILLAIVLAGIALVGDGMVLPYQDKSAHYWFALSREKPPEYWFINPLFGPHRFHTLSPAEGPALILATLTFYAILDRRMRVSEKWPRMNTNTHE